MADLTVSFELYNEETVRILKEEDPDLLPDYSVNSSKDLAYNKKQVTSAITSGIIKGESIPKIASNLQSTIKSLNQSSAVSAARTAAIAAQNTGSLSSMKRLAEMGVEVQKEWVATLDVRTRPSHRALDGQRRNLDEAFSNGLQYPGASGNPAERWNCRCKIKAYMPKYDSEDEPRLTYSEWTAYKKATGSTAKKITESDYNKAKIFSRASGTIIFNKQSTQFNSDADPMAEVTGSAYESNPKEIEEIKTKLAVLGVEINEDSENIGYGCTSIGHPGVLSINRLASYSAWLHELKHIEDDQASGWRGIEVLFNTEERIEWESRAYQVEIDNAMKLGRQDIAERLEENLDDEIRRIKKYS